MRTARTLSKYAASSRTICPNCARSHHEERELRHSSILQC